MTMRVRTVLLAAAACAYVFIGAGPAAAGDHLRCYKTRDSLSKVKFTNVTTNSNTGLPSTLGCTVSVPSKMCCDAVDKIGVSPTPPGGGPAQNTTKFCCYKAKCPKATTDLVFTVKDQFGSRSVLSKRAGTKFVCSPAS